MNRAATFTLLLVAGCGSIDVNYVPLRPAPPPTREVALFFENPPARPYTEVGLLQALATGGDAQSGKLLVALRDRAQALGCDAVVRIDLTLRAGSGHALGVCVAWVRTP